MTRRVIVIVGGGLAGLRAAERLRERGFDGFITMIGDELVAPYNRPPLSKQLLTGKMRQEELGFQTFTRLAVSLRSGQRAARLDPVGQCVQLESGEEVPYDGLIVATGVSARVLPDMPLHDDRISVLRTLADFRRLERVVRDARSLAVVGGGFVGCEVAASARRRSVGVTIIDRAPALLHRVLGPHVGASLTQVHRQAGVDLRLGTGIDGWSTGRAGVSLELSDGSSVCADAVLVAVGTEPVVDWLSDSGAEISDGVLCDATSHVRGMEHVVAAGDVARWPNMRFGHEPRRVEHWINAIEHGRAAADSLLDGRARARPFTPVPRFWSEQHGVKIQSVGMPALADHVELVQGDLEQHAFTVACKRDGRIVAAQGFNSPRAMLQLADQVETSNPVPTEDQAIQRIGEALTMIHHPARDHRDPPEPQRSAAAPWDQVTTTAVPPRADVVSAL